MKKLVVGLINLYQKTLSPDHGWMKAAHPYGYCRFSPSCSQYAKEAVESKGVIQGGVLAIRRIMRCNPWHPGGIDKVS